MTILSTYSRKPRFLLGSISFSVSLLFLTFLPSAFNFGTVSNDVAPYIETKNLNPESVFALSRKIPFSSVGIYELEMIPGVSDTFSTRIFENKNVIIRLSKSMPPSLKWKAFEVIRGIGVKKAKVLSGYLDLES